MRGITPEPVTDPADPLVAELVERHLRYRVRFRHHDEAASRADAADEVQQLLAGSRLLALGGGRFLWLGPDEDHTQVHDVHCDDPAEVPAVRELATSLAGSRLAVGVPPGAATQEAFVAGGGFRLVATNMRLDVTGGLPGEELAGRVSLTPMTDPEVAAYREGAVATYARSREEAGESPELARTTAEQSLALALPGGRPGEGHHLFAVRHEGRRAGILWVARRWPAQAWVYDVEIEPAFRGRGLGAAAMVHAARWARELGTPWLGLNVFGHNRHARGLYERLGYLVEEEHHLQER